MSDLETIPRRNARLARGELPARHAAAARRRRRPLLGRAQREIQVRGPAPVARAHGGARLDRAGMAAGIWRRRPLARGGQNPARRDAQARLPFAARSRSASGCSVRPCCKYGTTAQKREYLPQIARGEIRWCQGYSEPERRLGPRLAARPRRRTRAIIFSINGQKIWTSYADKADWIFCLVRTDPAAPKHLGISFVLFDMKTPGRLDQADPVDFRQVAVLRDFLRQCRAFPRDNLSARSTRVGRSPNICLTHEREMISAHRARRARARSARSPRIRSAREAGVLADTMPARRHRAL